MTTSLPKPPVWARTEGQPTWPYYDGFPRQYRVNQETGNFMRGSEDLGNELTAIVFNHCWETGAMGKGVERWGFGLQVWLDVAFIDAAGFASILSLKKDSATNLHVCFQEIAKTGAVPYTYRLHLTLEQVQGHNGPYYIAKVSDMHQVSEAQGVALKKFCDEGGFEFHLIGETTKGPHDDLPDGSDY